MPSTESEAVRRHWGRSRLAMERPDADPVSDDDWGALTAEPDGVGYTETVAAGLPALWVEPAGCAADRVLLCLHGGGFLSGSIASHRRMFGHLARAAGVRALVFDYHLAPGHTHPAQLDEATEVYRWLLGQGIHARRVAFAGDSCGGALAITAQLLARRYGLPLPAAALLMSPWVDLEATGGSYAANGARDPFFSADAVRKFAALYLAGADPRDPRASPLYGDLTGLGPVYIQVGGDETLLDDAHRLDEHARKAGVDVRLDVFPGMLHTFQMAAGNAPEADRAIRDLAGWVRPRLGLGDRRQGR